MRNVIGRVVAGTAGVVLATAVSATAVSASTVSASTASASTVSASAVSAGAARPGSAAAAPGWRVNTVFTGLQFPGEFVATSARDAWSSWATADLNPVREHWNGTAWRQLPAVPSSMVAGATLDVGASSATDYWEFTGDMSIPPVILRWNGKAWRLQQIPGWVIRDSPGPADDLNAQAAVFSPNLAWVFSIGDDGTGHQDHLAGRYNGRTWTKVPLPAVPRQVSALAPNDIWGHGPAAAGRHPDVLMHWNGKRWATTEPLPTVKPPRGALAFALELTATGPRDAWLEQEILLASGATKSLYLLHWNGTRWAKVTFGVPVSQVDDMARDGHGGLWLIDQGPAPAQHWYLDHLNAGHWTRYAVPAVRGMSLQDLTSLTWIPGTRSIWATGDMSGPPSGHGIFGLVLKFGP